MYNFENKVVVVTGGSNGIGETIVREFAKANAKVVLNYRSDSVKANQILEDLRAKGYSVTLKQGSVEDEDFIKNMFKEVNEEFGRIDILVNNAGITKDAFLMISKSKDIESVINTNLKGVMLCSKYVAPYMINHKSGKIINMSSVSGLRGTIGQTAYSASKAGIIGFTQSLAKELARYNIHVNAIAPGFIETNMTNKLSSRLKKEYSDRIPLGKFGATKDIAYLVQFLCTDECKYIIGQTIAIDGGLSC